MRHADTGTLHATYDMVEVVFDPATRRSAEMPAAVRAALEAHLVEPDA
jgi:acyl-CoA thioester hydrolase